VSQPSESTNPAEPQEVPPGFVSDAIDREAAEGIERLAAEQVGALTSGEPGTAELRRTIAAIDRLGERDFVATAAMSGRLLDRRFRLMDGLLGSKAPMARQLADLRKAAAAIDPTKLKLGGKRSAEDEIREFDRYFERFGKAQPRLEEILGRLGEGRLLLEQDSAAIMQEEASLGTEMETLRQYAFLTERIDQLLTAHIDTTAATDPRRADGLRVDVLSVVRRRRQEILTQLAIATQGFVALRMVEQNNAEVVRAVASAISTTTAAMRTAVMTAQAAASRRMAMEHLQAARLAADTMADQAAALEAGTTDPAGGAAVLRQAWGDVYAALDRVEAQKAQVLRTISQADRELTKPKPGSR
jgi:uncharacterized protein YaaN involved in tellurite resistance